MRPLLALAFLFLCLALTGCKDQDEAGEVLPTMCDYFPESQIYKIDPRLLWIQTHVGGVSAKTAKLMFDNACQQAAKNYLVIKFNVTNEMKLDHKSILVVGFNQYLVTWEIRNGTDSKGNPRSEVISMAQAKPWFAQHLGYIPAPDQILVVTLADVQNTPKGQDMQLQTLAQIQQSNKEKIKELQQQLSK